MPTSKTGSAVLNAGRKKAWRADGPSGGECVWAREGVWGWAGGQGEGEDGGKAVVLRENYFVKHPLTGKKVCLVSCRGLPPSLPPDP
jgi:hypothetical protein